MSLFIKSVAAVWFMYIKRAKMDRVQAILDLESTVSKLELLEALKHLMKLLKQLCHEMLLKLLIDRLLTYWAHSFVDDSDCKTQ